MWARALPLGQSCCFRVLILILTISLCWMVFVFCLRVEPALVFSWIKRSFLVSLVRVLSSCLPSALLPFLCLVPIVAIYTHGVMGTSMIGRGNDSGASSSGHTDQNMGGGFQQDDLSLAVAPFFKEVAAWRDLNKACQKDDFPFSDLGDY